MRPLVPSLACLAILAGCAGNPQRVVDQGRQYDFTSAMPPRALAVCAVQNARSFSGNFTADYIELVRPEHFQAVVMRTSVGMQPYETILVARTWPTVNGSQMAVYADGGLGAVAEADWIARLRRGCEIGIQATNSAPVYPVVPPEALPAVNPPPPPAPASPLPGRQPRG